MVLIGSQGKQDASFRDVFLASFVSSLGKKLKQINVQMMSKGLMQE